MVISRVADVGCQGRIGAGRHRRGRVWGWVHGVQVAIGRGDRGCRARVSREVVHGRDRGSHGWRHRGLGSELGAFTPAGRQKIAQLRLVSPVHPLRRWLRRQRRRHHRPRQAIAVREVAVGQSSVQIAHLEVHGPFAEQISTLLLPKNVDR